MSGKRPKATEKKPPSRARKPSVKAKAAKEAASDSETTKTKKTPKTKGWGKKVAEPAEDSSDGERMMSLMETWMKSSMFNLQLWFTRSLTVGTTWWMNWLLNHPWIIQKKFNGQSTQAIHRRFTVLNLHVNRLPDRILNRHVSPHHQRQHLLAHGLQCLGLSLQTKLWSNVSPILFGLVSMLRWTNDISTTGLPHYDIQKKAIFTNHIDNQ